MQLSFSLGSSGFMFMRGGVPTSSNCGDEFDNYVNRVLDEPFPFGPLDETSRTLDDLWKNRRFRLYQSPNQTREGKVIGWKQSSSGPFCGTTRWEVSVEMDQFDAGDTVVIQDLPKAHKGKRGEVLKRIAGGKLKIKLEEDELQFVTVLEKHLKSAPTNWRINRMNVHGGGTLKRCGIFENEELVSLEWLDPPSPVIHLNEVSKQVTCPTCRAIEPTQQAYSDNDENDSANGKDEKCKDLSFCPICTENKPCRTLQCNHHFCHDCWRQWRKPATSEIPWSVSVPILAEDKVQRERDRSFQRWRARLPHTQGGTATKATGRRKSTDAEIYQAIEDVRMSIGSFLQDLDDAVESGGEEGLVYFWEQLLLVSVHVLCIAYAMNELVSDLSSIAAVEIVMQVVESRTREICNYPELVQIKLSPEAFVQYLYCLCCNRIGELYESSENFQSAIHWYERSVMYATTMVELEKNSSDEAKAQCVGQLSAQYNNLGLAQKKAGLLSQALASNNTAIEKSNPVPLPKTQRNLEALKSEIEEWTGTSGKLTPGC